MLSDQALRRLLVFAVDGRVGRAEHWGKVIRHMFGRTRVADDPPPNTYRPYRRVGVRPLQLARSAG